jgi:hypothetical protein
VRSNTRTNSGKTVDNKFGTFSNACEKAGVLHDKKPQKKEKEQKTLKTIYQKRVNTV